MKTNRSIDKQYINEQGFLVTVYKARAPRPSEKTWRSGSKYSIANKGHQKSMFSTGLVKEI